MLGVTIGDGAVMTAYSAVSGDIPPYGAAGGNPARLIKKRFPDGLIQVLLTVKWWDLNPEKLIQILPLLCDPDLRKV